jgi:hypothetical protein
MIQARSGELPCGGSAQLRKTAPWASPWMAGFPSFQVRWFCRTFQRRRPPSTALWIPRDYRKAREPRCLNEASIERRKRDRQAGFLTGGPCGSQMNGIEASQGETVHLHRLSLLRSGRDLIASWFEDVELDQG